MNFNFWKNYISLFSISRSTKQKQQQIEKLRDSKSWQSIHIYLQRAKNILKASKTLKRSWIKQQRLAEKARQLQHQQIEKTRIAKEKIEAFVCKRCSVKFSNNINLHEHVRTKHAKKLSSFFTSIELTTSSISSSSTLSITITITTSSFTSIISHATTSATSKTSISWVEIISKSKTSTTSSRLSRFTLKYDLFTSSSSSHLSSKSSILLHQKSINNMKNRFFITWFKTSYFTMQNLYIKFHDKSKSLSLIIIQNSLSSAFSLSMRIRQTRITSYFKSAIKKFTNQIKLISNKKHVDLKISVISIWIDHLTSKNSYDNHSITHHTCRCCSQQFISKNKLHKHLRHCSRCIEQWSSVEHLIEERHIFTCTTINLSFSLLAHAE